MGLSHGGPLGMAQPSAEALCDRRRAGISKVSRLGAHSAPAPCRPHCHTKKSSARLGLGILPRTVRSRELPGTILRGRTRGVQLCGCEGLPPRPPCPICECVGFPDSKRPSQRKKSTGRKIPDPCFPLLDLPLLGRAGEPRAGAAPVAGN